MPNNNQPIHMKTDLNKKEYQIPSAWEIPVVVECQFVASQLEDYEENSIFDDDDD